MSDKEENTSNVNNSNESSIIDIQNKKNFTPEQKNYLITIKNKCRKRALYAKYSYAYHKVRYRSLTIPVYILESISAGTAFSVWQNLTNESYHQLILLGIAIFNGIVFVMSLLSNTLGFQTKMAEDMRVYDNYQSLARDISMQMILPEEYQKDAMEFFNQVTTMYNKYSTHTLQIPESVQIKVDKLIKEKIDEEYTNSEIENQAIEDLARIAT